MEDINERIKVYVKALATAYNELREELKELSSESLYDASIIIMQNALKDYKPRKIETYDLATKNQRRALHKFGVEVLEDISRDEASKLLNRLIYASKHEEGVSKIVEEANKKYKVRSNGSLYLRKMCDSCVSAYSRIWR
ncbi:MAG: hypothetical protein QXZ17_03630 [Nitrososphaerota archaeon]